MLSVAEALSLIFREVQPFAPEPVPLDDALGLVLADAVVSRVASPPFDKALMDGFAVRAADLTKGTATLRILEEVTAGRLPQKTVQTGYATRIMTGAPLPAGADAVVRIEDCTIDAAHEMVRVVTNSLKAGTNVLPRAATLRKGEEVLPAGRHLRPQELGALAELGYSTVAVRHRPRVAILATGDELVPVGGTLGPGQIYNSNEIMLAAQVRRAGGLPVPLGVARDERSHLREKIRAGLHHDVLLLSGGVSAGTLDLVPSELEAAGVTQIFHKVDVKPGKPLWYGHMDPRGREPADAEQTPCHVFGLPGNPVSSLVCLELFARPVLRRLMGMEPAAAQPIRARLAAAHVARSDRPTYHPARMNWTDSGPVVHIVPWIGSSDLRATVDANGMACFPPGDAHYNEGDGVDVISWD